jgi:hypothetical protein
MTSSSISVVTARRRSAGLSAATFAASDIAPEALTPKLPRTRARNAAIFVAASTGSKFSLEPASDASAAAST